MRTTFSDSLFIFCGLWAATICLVFAWDTKKTPWQNSVLPSKFGNTRGLPCSTLSCKQMAKKVGSAMNTSANPCDDFFAYACGSWIASHPLGDNLNYVDQYSVLNDKMTLVKQEIMEKNAKEMFPAEVKAKAMYQQCKNRGPIEASSINQFVTFVTKVMGGWPILFDLKTWEASNFDLFNVLMKIRPYGLEPFLSINTDADLDFPTINVVSVDKVHYYTSADILQSVEGKAITEDYAESMRSVVSVILSETGDLRNEKDPGVVSDMADIIALEKYFITSQPLEEERKKNISRFRRKQSFQIAQQRAVPRFKSALLKNITNLIKATYAIAKVSMEKSFPVVVYKVDDYLDRVDDKLYQMEKEGAKGKRRLANFIGWQIFRYYNSRFPSEFFTDLKYINRTQHYVENCAQKVNSLFPLVFGATYLRDYVPKDLKPKGEAMVIDLKAAFEALLNKADWMDQETKKNALLKLQKMDFHVAYADYVKNSSVVNAAYKEFELQKTYFLSIQEFERAKSNRNLLKITKQNAKDDLFSYRFLFDDTAVVNAFYLQETNYAAVHAGLMQPPFYDADSPQWANYGGLGYVLGHEITHGFDVQGRQFDWQGELKTWWTEKTLAVYEQRTKDMIVQYNAYKGDFGSINGTRTIMENMADNGGVKLAYQAYKAYEKRLRGPEPVLDGLQEFTADQLFFLSFAQVQCGAARPEVDRQEMSGSGYSPTKYRAIGPLSNLPEFSASFNCPIGSPMNPAKKAVVW